MTAWFVEIFLVQACARTGAGIPSLIRFGWTAFSRRLQTDSGPAPRMRWRFGSARWISIADHPTADLRLGPHTTRSLNSQHAALNSISKDTRLFRHSTQHHART